MSELERIHREEIQSLAKDLFVQGLSSKSDALGTDLFAESCISSAIIFVQAIESWKRQ